MGDDIQFCYKGRVIKSYSSEVDPISAVCISPDDDVVISCHKEKVILWNMQSCEQLGKLEGHRSDITACSISDELLATGSENGIIHLWKYKTQKRVARIGLPLGPINTCSLSPNGQCLAVGFAEGKPRIYTIYGGDGALLQGPKYKELNGHTGGVMDMKFSSSSINLLTTSTDGTIRLWKVSNGECLLTIDPGEGCVMQADFSGGSNVVFTTDNGITAWSLTDNERAWNVEGGFQLMCCSNVTHTVASVTANGRLCCYNIASEKETVKKGTAHTDEILACVCCASGKHFLTGGADGKLFLWE